MSVRWLCIAPQQVVDRVCDQNTAAALSIHGEMLFQTDIRTEAEVLTVCRGAYDVSHLQAFVTDVDGTNTINLRRNSSNQTAPVLSITATGYIEDTSSNTNSYADGDTIALFATGGGMHGNLLDCNHIGFLMDDGGNDTSMWVHSNFKDYGAGWSTAARYGNLIGKGNISGTEALVQLKVYTSLTLSNFRIYASANSFTASTTWRTRVNGSNGSQSVSLSSATTGSVEDTTNSDSISANDLVNMNKDSGGTSGSATISTIQVKCAASVGYPMAYQQGSQVSLFSVTYSPAFCTLDVWTATETNHQYEANQAEDLTNLQVYMSENSLNATCTMGLREDSADAGPTVSISSSSTGRFEDTSNTYTTVAADKLALEYDSSAATSGQVRWNYIGLQSGTAAAAIDTGWMSSPVTVVQPQTVVASGPGLGGAGV